MTINPIPVTFHIRADRRPALDEPARRRIRPYSTVVQSVGMVAFVGAMFGFIAGSFGPAPESAVVSAPQTRQTAAAVNSPAASFPVARPPQQAQTGTPVRPIQANAGAAAGSGDPTPVASIAGREPPARGFAPAERAPEYSGFRIVAGR